MAPGTNQATMDWPNDVETLIGGLPAERLSMSAHTCPVEQTQMHAEASEMMRFVDDMPSAVYHERFLKGLSKDSGLK